MKPPWRPRLLPSRFAAVPAGPGKPQRGAWGLREKRALLAALRAQARCGIPERRLPAVLKERLPHRSEEEIRALLVRLRGRAAREALTSKFRNFLRLRRQIRAPIQLWQDLAETLAGGALEGPPSAAFSQVLTVAATEPLSLDPPQNPGAPPNSGPPQNPGTPSESGGTPQNSEFGDLRVDFGKIYEFLAQVSAGGGGAPPAPRRIRRAPGPARGPPAPPRPPGGPGGFGAPPAPPPGALGVPERPPRPGGAPPEPRPPPAAPPEPPLAAAGRAGTGGLNPPPAQIWGLIPEFPQGIPQFPQGIPKFPLGIPNSQGGSPNFHRGSPNFHRESPNFQEESLNFHRESPNLGCSPISQAGNGGGSQNSSG